MPWFSASQRTHLRERCAALGLEFLDLTSALQAAARERGPEDLLYWSINIHWTQAGNRVVSEALAPEIERLLRARRSHAFAADSQTSRAH